MGASNKGAKTMLNVLDYDPDEDEDADDEFDDEDGDYDDEEAIEFV